MMADPRFSVIVPVYNRRVLVERAIRSVREQAGGDAAELASSTTVLRTGHTRSSSGLLRSTD